MANQLWTSHAILEFTGKYAFLSNFFFSWMSYLGNSCRTAEHAFQSAKSLDPVIQKQIADSTTAKTAKQRGRAIKLRPDWEEKKIQIMREVVTLKFAMNPELARLLFETGDLYLVEGNTWGDRFWGVDIRWDTGENWLGIILMEVRYNLSCGSRGDFYLSELPRLMGRRR